jgi:hypothetical protein
VNSWVPGATIRWTSALVFELLALACFPCLASGFLFLLLKDAALAPPWPFIRAEDLPWFLLSLALPLVVLGALLALAAVPRRRERQWPELAEYGGFER